VQSTKSISSPNPDGTIVWEETTTSTVSFTDEDLKQLGFTGEHELPEEVRDRCRAIPIEIVRTPIEKVFGRNSDPALANQIAKQYPPLYRQMKRNAIEVGLIAGKNHGNRN